jgi:hypothetical protein
MPLRAADGDKNILERADAADAAQTSISVLTPSTIASRRTVLVTVADGNAPRAAG